MSPRLQVPDDLEEQDIALYYHSRRSSPALSESDLSSLMSMSRPASRLQLDTAWQEVLVPPVMQGPLKSPSLTQVVDAEQHRRLTIHQPILRSKTLSHLPSSASTEDDSPSFSFPAEKVLKMREWVLAFAVVQFDLDLGPVVRAVYPPVYLSPSERENIAFSSFPDSLQFEQGSEVHSFRIRVYPEAFKEDVYEERRPQPLDGFMYGFSHFRQKRDSTSKRGYQQVTFDDGVRAITGKVNEIMLVFLGAPDSSPIPSTVYLNDIPTRSAFPHPWGRDARDSMSQHCKLDAKERQTPSPGSTVELGFLGSVLHVELPISADSQQLAETNTFEERFNPAVHLLASSGPFNPPPIRLFEASLEHLWSLWECLVLCEPILVFAPSPSMTSQAVWWLRDLLRPIPLAADIRPYFTIHDKDHSLFVNKSPPKAGLLIGVTNPFFEKSCAHWPHLLSIGRKSTTRTGANKIVTGPSPGWTSKTHRRHISKDRKLLKSLEKACAGHEEEQMQASLDMRRHFSARTNAMLVPLNRYLNTLIPSPSERHAGKVRLKPFSASDFLGSLKKSPSALPFKSSTKQREFYDKWLRSPAFGLWLARQEEVVGALLRDKAG